MSGEMEWQKNSTFGRVPKAALRRNSEPCGGGSPGGCGTRSPAACAKVRCTQTKWGIISRTRATAAVFVAELGSVFVTPWDPRVVATQFSWARLLLLRLSLSHCRPHDCSNRHAFTWLCSSQRFMLQANKTRSDMLLYQRNIIKFQYCWSTRFPRNLRKFHQTWE